MKKAGTVILIATLLSGCATSSKDVATTYVSPIQYKDYSCDQISAELMRVSSRATELGGRLDQAAQSDAAITGIGLILFWPALFALGGTKQQEADYGRLKGEYEALSQLSVQKNCMAGGGTAATPAPTTQGIPAASMSIDEATKKCIELGFKPGTEEFGQCALKLSR